ncbi:MAG: O-antigen biosynthesis protein, partial [Comamonas sp.]
LVAALQDEVEWVFMGMKPQGVRCEFHTGVSFEQYPAKLASLDLDLAVVPLEINRFNECKSNLRLMELGILGVPVVCTDIEPYRCGLPVTRVRNRFKDWHDAVRAHLHDRDASEQAGDALRAALLRDWMLEGDNVTAWARAWLPG